MKTIKNSNQLITILISLCAVVVIAAFFAGNQVMAKQVQNASGGSFSTGVVSYQGTLTDEQGNPVTGLYELQFSMYNLPSEGAPLWVETRSGVNSVRISNGLFNVMLGSLTPIPISVWESSDLYLGVKVGSDSEMAPREKLTFVPGANVAQVGLTVPDGSITDQKLGQDVNNYLIESGVNVSDTYLFPDWILDEGTGVRDFRTRITFSSAFSTPPIVTVSISSFDIWSGSNPRLQVHVENVTVEGFDLVYHTWADTIVYGASASWIAYGLK
jgi:H-type lectin domain.